MKPAEILTLAAGRTVCSLRYGPAGGRPVVRKRIVAAVAAAPR